MFINFSDQYLLICVLYNFVDSLDGGRVWRLIEWQRNMTGRVVNQLCHLTLNQYELIINIFNFSVEKFLNIHVNNFFKWRHFKLSSVDSDKYRGSRQIDF